MAKPMDNPLSPALVALALARAAPRCRARSKRHGGPCGAPAMRNGVCYHHGGRSPGAPRGERHGNYQHGGYTVEGEAERREFARLTRELLREARETRERIG